MAAAAAAVGTGPRYAPHDPTLPTPWRALVDGNTGYLYYWNPETNVTQYEKPVAQAPPVPPGPPPVVSTPKLAPIPTGPSVHGQQQGGGAVLHAGEDNRGGRLGNDHHSDANKVAMSLTGQPKIATIPVMRNPQSQPQPQPQPQHPQHHQQQHPQQQLQHPQQQLQQHPQQQHPQQQHQQHQQQQHMMPATNSSHVPPGFGNGSSVPAGLGPRQAAEPYKYVPNGTNYPNPNVKPTPRMQGNAEIPNSTAVDAYRRQHEVSAQGNNVPAPFMTFDQTGFPPEILRELQNAGFSSPTPIQAQSWPIAMQNQDIVAIAKTGSGKTLGYLLPAFIHLRRRCNNIQMGPTVLVLAPTRELATQIQEEAIKFGRSSRITCTCLYGGAPKGPQLRDLERGVDIVVATPGRLNDILETKKVNLRQVSFLALDEADRMLDMGFEPQIRKIVNEIPRQRQTLMYTATWPKEVRKIAGDLLVNPVQVTIGTIDELAANNSITQFVEIVAPMDKQRRLEQILRGQEPGSRVIIFCSTKRMCDNLARSLGRQFGAIAIHGDKSQGERDWVLGQFRTGKSPVLVATDVAARGLDIKDIRVVINYDFPTGVEDYVHRIGRTGRAGATGLAHTFLSDQDAKYAPDLIKVLERANQRVPPEVRDMASRAGSFSKGRGGRWDFGGRGGRDAGRGFGGGRVDSFGGRGGWGAPGGRSDRGERGFGGYGGGRGRYERDTRDRYDGGRDGFDVERHDRGRTDRYVDDRDRGRDDYRSDWDRGRSYSRSPSRSRVRKYSISRSRSRSRSRSLDRYSDRYHSYKGNSPDRFVGSSPLKSSSPSRRNGSPVRSFSPRKTGSPYGRPLSNREVSPNGSRSPYKGVPLHE